MTDHGAAVPGPLAGVRVLDLSRILAGPWATQLLADMGADVVKVERPGLGDDTRRWGPPFTTKADGTPGDAAYYLAANRNKASVCIDFTQDAGADLVRRLAAESDVVVENFKTGGLAKYGLDYASLAAVRPSLVYCSITGFGQTGPYAKRAGYDYLIQAMGGLMSITGHADGAPGGGPLRVGVAVADLFTGLYASNAILAALLHARATGEGQHIDMALLDCQAAVLANQAQNYFVSGEAPARIGNQHPNIAPYQVFATEDGHMVLAVGNDKQFAAFCELAGAPDLAEAAEFATNAARVANRDALILRLEPILATRATAAWIEALEGAGVPCGPINTLAQVYADPQIEAREMVQTLAREAGGEVRTVGAPIKFSKTPVSARRAPPPLGADTEAVLRERLGLAESEIAALAEGGAVG